MSAQIGSAGPGGAEAKMDEVAARHGVGREAAEVLLHAVVAGGGTMAQFDIAELGGHGQWMRGGMTMVGTMSDEGLRARVDRLASELATLYFDPPFLLQREGLDDGAGGTDTGVPSGGSGQWQSQGGGERHFGGNWWPADLGAPASSGTQNDARYAYFPGGRRLAVQAGDGAVSLYDTTGYDITGVGQQQSSFSGSAVFSTRDGAVPLESLPRISSAQAPSAREANEPGRGDAATGERGDASRNPPEPAHAPVSHADILDALERLATLRDRKILTDEEFADKKRDLLGRL